MSSSVTSTHEKALFEQGLGSVTWWGFSPAENFKNSTNQQQDILLLGAGDARQIIATLAGLKGS